MARPKNPQEGSWTLPGGGSSSVDEFQSVSLVDEIRSKGYGVVDVIKLDIEGFEYEVVESLLESDLRIGQILLEYHHFFPNISIKRTRQTKRFLKEKGFVCYYRQGQDHCYIHRSKLSGIL
jgi:hypothetical protein